MKTLILRLLATLVYMPFMLFYCYLVGPILKLVLVPGAILLLLVIGRGEAWQALKEGVFHSGSKAGNQGLPSG
ncbi:hypothetical protein [Zobellella maritima]|uniref:hypothetical protein n=1 Tax=Zobellella maritima TaxID=2059725 RepID=UPI001300B979|nr:hypothetical protein [Zobellella maritima]